MPAAPVAVRIFALAALIALRATTSGAGELFAGHYSFSDELGGFRLLEASGTGTPDDPIIVVEELTSVDPVTLVIRRHNIASLDPRRSQLNLTKKVVNRSERIWAGFEVELQEILEKPSNYEDGLSFKQFAAKPADVGSDSFTLNDRRFEPYDRITFQGGSVDPGATVHFRLTITDPTPVAEFYLLQDPNLLSAAVPGRGKSFAWRAD
jgi:hypothetical protein